MGGDLAVSRGRRVHRGSKEAEKMRARPWRETGQREISRDRDLSDVDADQVNMIGSCDL